MRIIHERKETFEELINELHLLTQGAGIDDILEAGFIDTIRSIIANYRNDYKPEIERIIEKVES